MVSWWPKTQQPEPWANTHSITHSESSPVCHVGSTFVHMTPLTHSESSPVCHAGFAFVHMTPLTLLPSVPVQTFLAVLFHQSVIFILSAIFPDHSPVFNYVFPSLNSLTQLNSCVSSVLWMRLSFFSNGKSKGRTNSIYYIFSSNLYNSPIHRQEIGSQGD